MKHSKKIRMTVKEIGLVTVKKVIHCTVSTLACRLLTVVLILFAGYDARAQTTPRLPPQVKFKHTLPDQLEKLGHINSIHKDAQGYLWIAAIKGLARYDGYTIHTYEHQVDTPQSLSHLWSKQLVLDSRKTLWVVTHTGLCQYQSRTDGFNCETGTKNAAGEPLTFDYLFEDRFHQMWVGTSQGIRHFDPASGKLSMIDEPLNTVLATTEGAAQNTITAIIEGQRGELWFGLENNGIVRYSEHTNSLIHYREGDGHSKLPSNHIRSLLMDSRGTLWAGTLGSGVVRFNENTGEFDLFSHSANEKADTVWDILEDQQGIIWIGDGSGVHLFNPDNGELASYTYVEGQPRRPGNFVVRDIYMDDTGELWIGYFPSGVDTIDPRASEFFNYQHNPAEPNSLADGGVLSTLEAANGDLWVGCGFGLSYLDRKTGVFKRYIHDKNDPDSLSGSTILDMVRDHDQNLWVAAWDRGINRKAPHSEVFKKYSYDPDNPRSLYGREPWGLAVDSDNTLWIATEKGINRYNRNSDDFDRVMPKASDGTPFKTLYSRNIVLLSDGNLWISSYNGLYVLNPRTLEYVAHYTNDPHNPRSLSWDQVMTTFQDSRGNIWVGTFGGGLNLFNPDDQSFKRFGPSHGVPNSTVSSIIEDTAGHIWISTFEGIARFNRDTETFIAFTKNDGLIGNLYNRDTGSLLASGEIVFGSSRGLTLFDPRRLKANQHLPPVVLTDFKIFNQSQYPGADSPLKFAIGATQAITLKPEQSVFSIAYAALDFRSPQLNQYAYRLKGFEQHWNNVGNRRLATYTNLDPGTYIFEVKGSNNQGLWSPHPARLTITVTPPYWRTPIAYACYALAIASLLIRLLWRHRQQLEQQRSRLQQMTEVDRMKDEINRELDRKIAERTEALSKEHQRLLDTQEELQDLNTRLKEASVTDQLTGLKNRRFLYHCITEDINRIQTYYAGTVGDLQMLDSVNDLTFMIIDLDDFKAVNDEFGHTAGDLILVQFSDILKSVLNNRDYIIRWGGEEFVIVVRQVPRNRVEAIGSELIARTREYPFAVSENHSLTMTCSMGIAAYPFVRTSPKLLDWEETIGLADQALYAAKASGKNCWVRIQAQETAHFQFTRALLKAGSLSEHIAEGRVAATCSLGQEALVWRDPTGRA